MKKKVVPISNAQDLNSAVDSTAEVIRRVREEAENGQRVEYKRSIAYDQNGEVIYDVKKKPAWQNEDHLRTSSQRQIGSHVTEPPWKWVLQPQSSL